MKQTLSMLIALLLCLFAFASCDNVSFQNDDSQTTNDTPVCSRINLCYHGNKDTSITIEDAGICSELMTLITKADGTQGESSKGYYGVPYTLTIYFEGNEAPLVFCLWSDSQYSTSEQRDAEGYQYFFNDDLSDLYQYLEEKYPDEFWYSNNSQSGDSNTECVHTYGEWQYDETYHWCDWSCSLDLCDIDTTGEHIDKDGDSVCDTCNYIILNCVHTYGEWQYNETHHWRDWSCSLNMCRIETTGEHFDEDENGVCDKCGYFPPINSDVMGFNLQKIVFDSLENTKRTPTKDTDVIDGINATIKMGSNAYDAIEFCFYYNGNVSEELFEDMHYSNIVQANAPTRMIVRVKYNNINIEALKTLSQSSQIISIHISAASDLGVEPEPDIPMVDAEIPDVLIKIEKWNGDKFEGTVVNHLISYLEAGDKVLVVCDNQTMASETLYPIGTLVIVRFGRFDANVQPNILYAEAVENGEKYGNDNNNYITIGTAVSDVMSSYAISCKIPQEYSTDNTDIPILLSFGLIEGCDADTDNFSEIVLRAENDDGQTVIIKRINISEILKIEYLAENVWDENREWIIGFNYTHTESIVLPLSLLAGTSGQIHIGLYECSSTDLETMKLGSGAYVVLTYTRNESSISISAEAVR